MPPGRSKLVNHTATAAGGPLAIYIILALGKGKKMEEKKEEKTYPPPQAVIIARKRVNLSEFSKEDPITMGCRVYGERGIGA